jgi:peptide/nickel transport system substrate-binding protein
MLKGLRWPLLALLMASGLLILAWITRPENTPEPTPEPATAAPLALSTPVPTSAPEAITPVSLPAAIPAAPENILVEALVGQIHKLNPLLATYNAVDRDITSLIFEGLTTTNDYGEIIPDLAKSWTVSQDGLEYLFELRDDVLWQDGLPFTAQDVVFTMNVMSDPRFPGAESLYKFWRTVEVDALSEHLIRFRLTQPLASFPDQLRIGIVPAHVLEGTPVEALGQHPFNLSPIGTGPYQIEALTSSQGQIDGIQLRVAPVYRQRPEGAVGYQLDRVVFRTYPSAEAALDAYQQGEVNSISVVNPTDQAAAEQLPGLSLYTTIQPHVGALIYNWKNDKVRFLRNPRVRLALAYAINRTELVNKHLAGQAIVADSPLLMTSWAYEAGLTWPGYDPEQAKALLDMSQAAFEAPSTEPTATPASEEGAAPEMTATPETEVTPTATAEPEAAAPVERAITILTLDDPALIALANDIAASWAQVGFEADVKVVDAAKLQTRLQEGKFQAALVEFSFEPSADPDPYVFWHQGQYGTGQNYGGMDDRRISEALEGARRDPNGINRVVYYHRFQELFAERAPALVLYYPLYIYAADSRLQGVQLGFLSTPSDRFRHIQDWTFTTP